MLEGMKRQIAEGEVREKVRGERGRLIQEGKERDVVTRKKTLRRTVKRRIKGNES